ncbi:MAG TPA: TraY domain-containing protein [bacterium]|nr:TraY domain-containing protein [bacterium]
MAQLLVRDLDEKTVARLKKRAKANGRSLQAEAKRILEESSTVFDIDRIREDLARLRASLPPQTTDSVDLIREDRDNR